MPDVSDQLSEKAIALSIKTAKLDAKVLAKAIQLMLKGGGKIAKKVTTTKDMTGKGKQTVKQLARQGQGVSNIEIKDQNIKSFQSVARKYGVDFAVKKDNLETPPKWLVFFKGKDADALTAAFKEFSAKESKKQRNAEKPSVIKDLQKNSAKVKTQVIAKEKKKSRGGHEL
jgi:hypothetical protein